MQQIGINLGQITKEGDVNVINCHGAGVCPLYEPSESQLQAEFAERTGVWCPRQAREVFERLMECHNFTAPEIARVWGDTVTWDKISNELRIRISILDLFTAFGLFIALLLFYFIWTVPTVIANRHPSASDWGMWFVTSMMYMAGMYFVRRYYIVPRRVAIRINKALTS